MITSADHLNRAFKWGIALNIIYTVVEATIGILSGSMGLIADAGHNLSDVVCAQIRTIRMVTARRRF